MKYTIPSILLIMLVSCNNDPAKPENKIPLPEATETEKQSYDISWKGTIGENTPVFVYYQIDSNIVAGQIIYLNTKDQQPIRLIGTIDENKSYRLMEFEKSGNITGIITGELSAGLFKGSWLSPKTGKDLVITLNSVDTNITSVDFRPSAGELSGEYKYQYGKDGYQGVLNAKELENNKLSFSISAVTSLERGQNLADVNEDTIPFEGRAFIYTIPGSDHCEFKTKFYKDFAYVHYTRGYCMGQFGHNATIEGIFLKTY